MEVDLQHVEDIVKKKAREISTDEKKTLSEFKTTYTPRLQQMKANVEKAKEIVGRGDDPSFDDFSTAIAGMKRLIRLTRKSLDTVVFSTRA